MKKYLVALFAMFVIGGAVQAQIVSSKSQMTKIENVEKKTHFSLDFGFGSVASRGGFNLAFSWRREYNKYLAWDIASFGLSAPFSSPADYDELFLRTGIRGYSPKFYKNMRAYANLDMGYTCALMNYGGLASSYISDYTSDKNDYSSYLDYYSSYYRSVKGKSSSSYSKSDLTVEHGFGLEFGFGLELTKRISLGYALQYNTASEAKNHLAKICFIF